MFLQITIATITTRVKNHKFLVGRCSGTLWSIYLSTEEPLEAWNHYFTRMKVHRPNVGCTSLAFFMSLSSTWQYKPFHKHPSLVEKFLNKKRWFIVDANHKPGGSTDGRVCWEVASTGQGTGSISIEVMRLAPCSRESSNKMEPSANLDAVGRSRVRCSSGNAKSGEWWKKS